jgi:hypothetical protein
VTINRENVRLFTVRPVVSVAVGRFVSMVGMLSGSA